MLLRQTAVGFLPASFRIAPRTLVKTMAATTMARTQGNSPVLRSSASDMSMALSVADTASDGGEGLRLASYNLHGWRDTDHSDNLERLCVTLNKIGADVVALQEVLHPFRPPRDPVAAQAYFDRVKAGKGNGFVADYLEDGDLP